MGNEVSKNYADKAMFTAAPVESKTPKVYLLNATPDPLGSIAAMDLMYKGVVIRNLNEVTDEQREERWEQVQKTILKAPLESVKMHFMVESVTRAFTHQMVRQRTAVYAQESMRFAVKENATEEVAIPPSLMGVEPWDGDVSGPGASEEQKILNIWTNTMADLGDAYNKLIEMGMPAEDARGMLPTNILTRIHYITDLRSLLDHSGVRLCTQAQFEWRLFWASLVNTMSNYSSCPGHASAAGAAICRICDNWQWKRLSTIFRPICYRTGKCEFMSNIDRACSIRNRVNANHDINRPSSEWDTTYDSGAAGGIVVGFNPNGVVRETEGGTPVYIGGIKPREWMADPAAARVK